MTQLQTIIPETGVPKQSKSSARRAIVSLLNKSTGRVPHGDLLKILAVVTAALELGPRREQ